MEKYCIKQDYFLPTLSEYFEDQKTIKIFRDLGLSEDHIKKIGIETIELPTLETIIKRVEKPLKVLELLKELNLPEKHAELVEEWLRFLVLVSSKLMWLDKEEDTYITLGKSTEEYLGKLKIRDLFFAKDYL